MRSYNQIVYFYDDSYTNGPVKFTILTLYQPPQPQMRESQSVDKIQLKSNRIFYNSLFNPMKELDRKKVETLKTDSQMIQLFYITPMLQMFQKNQQSFPNPFKIVQNIKKKQARIQELQKSLNQCKQKLREFQNNSKYQAKTLQTLKGVDVPRSQLIIKKQVGQQFLKLKIKFIPIIQQFIGESIYFDKLKTVENQKIPEILSECFGEVVKNLVSQIKRLQKSSQDKMVKKIKSIEQKYESQIKSNGQVILRINNKLKEKDLQISRYEEQRKKIQKEKSQLHTEIYKSHLTIVQKSQNIEDLREKMREKINVIQNLEKQITQLRKGTKQSQHYGKQLQQQNFDLKQRIRSLSIQNQKLQSQISQASRKNFNFYQNKSIVAKSQQTLTSIKLPNDFQSETDVKETIQRLRLQKLQKQIQLSEYKKQAEAKERSHLQKIVSQWRTKLERFLDDNDRETQAKDSLIEALEKQNLQLKKQIQLRYQINHNH